MRIYIKIILLLFVGIISFSCSNNKEMVNRNTVKDLDIDRFLGKWYEVARFPHSFEKGLTGVTATYSMREDGKIKVLNQGYKGSLEGPLKTAEGKAKIPDPTQPSKLKVSFFWIFYSDYLVMELDTINYNWAVIGSSSENYLWILSRTPQIEDDSYEMLIKRIEDRNYDTSKLIKVIQ